MSRSTSVLAIILIAGCAHPATTPTAMVGQAGPGPGAAVITRASVGTGANGLAYTPSSPAERELLPDEQVQQVLNRLAFGPTPGEAAEVRAIGVDKWIDQQLHPERIDDGAANAALARYTTLGTSTKDIVVVYQEQQKLARQQKAAGDSAPKKDARAAVAAQMPMAGDQRPLPQRALTDLESANLTRAVMSDRQLNEVMVEFWENHFSVYAGKGQTRLYLTAYDRDVIRPHALGKFRDLLGAVAHSSAMLFFLDNWESEADSLHPTLAQLGRGRGAGAGRGQGAMLQQRAPRPGLNENYGRELMELHTMGVDGGYTQHDVTEVARALTGWSIQPQQDGAFIFRPAWHDAAQKVVLGHVLPSGRGIDDGEEVLDIVAHHPSTAKFITTKLARHFVSDDPPQELIDRCAKVFTATDGDIRQTLGCIVTSREFFSRAAYRSKVKTPFEVVASALRAVNGQLDATPRAIQSVGLLGAPMFGHQTPEGWPDRGDAWMNTGAILNRINFGLMLAANRVPGVTRGPLPEIQRLQNAPREQQVNGVVTAFFGGQVSPETREILMSGNNPLATAADSSAAADLGGTAGMAASGGRGAGAGAAAQRMPPNAGGGARGAGAGRAGGANAQVNLQGLAQVVGLALGAPEFQRR